MQYQLIGRAQRLATCGAALARWLVLAGALAGALAAIAPAALAQDAATPDTEGERLRVTDPYIEMRTGPGRGYPIFYVAARDEWIEIELRHTDWFRVRNARGKVGWVQREQLESTLTEAGTSKTFRDVLLDDYLKRKLEFGAAYGRFKSDPMLKAWATYKLADTIAVEMTVGQVQGVFSGTDFWHLNLQFDPFADRRIAPFIGIGAGKFRNIPRASLIAAVTSDAKLTNAGVGVRFHVTERFVARLEYGLYTAYVSDQNSAEFRTITAGLSFFFF